MSKSRKRRTGSIEISLETLSLEGADIREMLNPKLLRSLERQFKKILVASVMVILPDSDEMYTFQGSAGKAPKTMLVVHGRPVSSRNATKDEMLKTVKHIVGG